MAVCRQWDRLWQHPSLGPGFCSLAPGCRHRREKKPPPRGFYRNNASPFVFFTLFCSLTALDEMGFIPGNRKDILVLSWFWEVRGLQSSCSWRGGWGITCCGLLTLMFCPSPSLSASSSRAALTQGNKPALWGLFFLQRFQSLLRVTCWVSMCLIGRKISSQNTQVRAKTARNFLYVPFPPSSFTPSRISSCFSLAAL